MKSFKKKILVLILLGMAFVCLPNMNLNFDFRQNSSVKIPKGSAGHGESFIHIDDNWTATLAEPWCNFVDGEYVIENLTIDATSSPTESGIYISNHMM